MVDNEIRLLFKIKKLKTNKIIDLQLLYNKENTIENLKNHLDLMFPFEFYMFINDEIDLKIFNYAKIDFIINEFKSHVFTIKEIHPNPNQISTDKDNDDELQSKPSLIKEESTINNTIEDINNSDNDNELNEEISYIKQIIIKQEKNEKTDENNDETLLKLKILLQKKEDLYIKKKEFDKTIEELISLKSKEKQCYDLLHHNQRLGYKIYNYRNTLQKYVELEETYKKKENFLYNKLKNEINQYEKQEKEDEKLNFKKSRLHFSRQYKTKTPFTIHSVNQLRVLNLNLKTVSKSDIFIQMFNDNRKEFGINYKKIYDSKDKSCLSISKDSFPLIYNFNKGLFLLMENKVFYYKNQEMNLVNNSLYSHSNGSFVYCKYDSRLYLLGGKESLSTERISYSIEQERLEGEWEECCRMSEYRMKFCCFCINDKVIYVILGNNPSKEPEFYSNSNSVLDTVTYYNSVLILDVSLLNDGWKHLKINNNHINLELNLKNSACLTFTYDQILIFGGTDEKDETNHNIYSFKLKTGKLENYFLTQPTATNTSTFNIKLEFSNVFHSNSCFVPIQIGYSEVKSKKKSNLIIYSLFDSSDTCHLVDVFNGKYYKISTYKGKSHLKNEEEEEDFDEDLIVIKEKNSVSNYDDEYISNSSSLSRMNMNVEDELVVIKNIN